MIAEKIREVKLKDVISEIGIDFGEKRLEMEIDNNALKRVHMGIDKVVEILNEKFKKCSHCGLSKNSNVP